MNEQTHAYRLSFLTNRNETMVLTIPRANPDLSDDEVVEAMQGIIGSGVVQSARGEVRFRQAAELLTKTRTDFDLFG